jgi:carboxyl-terminal processing protease
MQKFGCIALAICFTVSPLQVFAGDSSLDVPVLVPESQHKTSSYRIAAKFTRAHYKEIEINDALSEEVYQRYIKRLDYSRNVFLASDITKFDKYSDDFDDVVKAGKLNIAYEIFNLNIQRRLERYEYALTLLDKPFDFTVEEAFNFDREQAPWPKDIAELNELWRQKVKYDALSLTLADKAQDKIKETLTKRYQRNIKHIKQSESEDVFQTLMDTFARVIEPHTSYFSPAHEERFQESMNLSLEGIGAVLRAEEDYTVIQRIVSGSPAERTHQLKSKDKIVGVAQAEDDFVDIVGWRLDDVVKLIKGPKGSQVRLQILSGESDGGESKVVSIIRDTIKLEEGAAKSEVYYENNNVNEGRKLGVIAIPSFYHHLTRDVKIELDKLAKENIDGLIVDLRGNGGGSLTEAILLTGLFIKEGPVVQVKSGNNRIDVHRDRDDFIYYNGPLTVIVDRFSASASEIFSAAIQDYARGVIIGEHTFGKGTVQNHVGLARTFDLYDNKLGSISYTTAKFYRINGGSTQHRGVVPDILFPSLVNPEDWGESQEENALPWDQIPRAKYSPINDLQKDVAYLDALYKERIKNNIEFQYVYEDMVTYQKDKDKKIVSLNLKTRKAEREERKIKSLERANNRLMLLGKEKVTTLDDLPEELSELDPFLDESANITFDLLGLNHIVKNTK